MLESILNSYANILFSKSKGFAVLLLLVSFFNPVAGVCGLSAVLLAVGIAYFSGLDRPTIESGLYSYNAIFVGVGMGTFYEINYAFAIILATAVFFTVILSAVLKAWLGKYGLPFLSLPFVFTLWLVLLATKEFSQIGLSQRNIYWLNGMYATGGEKLVNFFQKTENLPLPEMVKVYFRALSTIFFQSNILAGILISLGLLYHSRIAFSLSIIGFSAAYLFNYGMGAGLNYYNLGCNFMTVSMAIGAFYVIPSRFSYLWAISTIPLTSLLVIGLGKIFGVLLLPIFSLPFCLMVITFLYFMSLRAHPKYLQVTQIQTYSPETNLYQHKHNAERVKQNYYFRFYLPFMGEWMVTQGHGGNITHKGDWDKALDFMVLDAEMKTFSGVGMRCEDYYCFNKPVISPAAGVVEMILDHVPDNPIGEVNTGQNWGNTIIIKHLNGLYTKMCHLRQYSFRVKIGDFVQKGDILALCGNSGRSPQPHLHFQVQSAPYIGAKTLAYPLAYFASNNHGKEQIHHFDVPKEGDFVNNLEISPLLKTCFQFQPGFVTQFECEKKGKKWIESWEVFTDAYNQSYLYCKENQAVAYFVSNETLFYFTAFYGKKNCMLYYFYLSAYKVLFSYQPNQLISDSFPLSLAKANPLRVLQDFIAPFAFFIRPEFRLHFISVDDVYYPTKMTLHSQQDIRYFGVKTNASESEILLENNRINTFSVNFGNQKIQAKCVL